jgi:hypothetical protein
MQDTIVCPTCGTEIVVSETLTAQIGENLRKEFDAAARRKDNELAARLEDLRAQEQKIELSRQSLEEQIANRVAEERTRLLQEATTKAHESVALEIGDLREQLQEARTKAAEAQQAELRVRKERRELEDEKREFELTVNRVLDEERTKIREQAVQQANEASELTMADKEKLIGDLRRQIDVLKRKSEQGSEQAQGEVMELELEDLLREQFPMDTFEPVPKGVHGGDVLQHVLDGSGVRCGTFLWESKRTKAWNDAWLSKLRDDQRAARAHAAVLLTAEMPKCFTTFGYMDGVWVTSRACVPGVASALRAGVIEVARTRRSLEGKQTKIEQLYHYLAGSEFRQRMEGVVEAYVTLKDDLDSEKRSVQRLWAKREKQLERAIANMAGMYGDLGGILGPSLPQIAHLELAAIPDDGEPPLLEPVGVAADDSPF